MRVVAIARTSFASENLAVIKIIDRSERFMDGLLHTVECHRAKFPA